MRENIGPLKARIRSGFPPFDERDARSIRVPTLLVTGEHSAPVLRRIIDRLGRLIPCVERVEIQGATHGMIWENPAAFNRAVLAFLDRHRDEPA
jgi:pimeloyl-ACP methyl ester carboxylesterase